jgi:hypothetical protein
MVKEAIIQKVIEKIYEEFNGKCVPFFSIYKHIKKTVYNHVKKTEHDVSESLVRMALEIMSKDGRLNKVKLYKSYVIYCIGKDAQLGVVFDYKKAEECVNKLRPSFTFIQLAECAMGHRPAGSPTPIYAAILYVLMRMVKDQKIHSFTVLLDARDRLKVIIKE